MEAIKIKKVIKDYFVKFFIISLGIIFGFTIVEFFFRQGQFFIILFSIPICIIVGAPAALIALILQYIFKTQKTKVIPIALSSIICIGIVATGKNAYAPSPETLFNRFVSPQVIQSISEVNGIIEYPSIDHVVRISFKISPTDFKLLKEEGDFKISQDDFAFRLTYVNNYPWWNSHNLKSLQTFTRMHSDELQYLWYDSDVSTAWFMSIDL